MDIPRLPGPRRLLALLLIGLLMLPLFPAAVSGAVGSSALGPPNHYNALLFDHFESVHGYMEGAMAVRGQARFGTTSGSYESGQAARQGGVGSFHNPRSYPTLLLGEAPAVGMSGYSNCNVWGGPVALSEAGLGDYQAGAQKFNIQDPAGLAAVDSGEAAQYFDAAYDAVIHTGLAIAHAHSEERRAAATLKLSDFVGWNTQAGVFDDLARFLPDNLDSGGARVLVIHVADEEHIEINAPRLVDAFAAYDMVILDFPRVSSARFTGAAVHIGTRQLNPYAAQGTADNDLLAEYATRLVWHLPQATAVQIAGHGIVGSLVAPRAYVEGSGGVIDGMLVARSLREAGGMHLNRFALDERFFSLANPDGLDALTGSVRLFKYDRNLGVGTVTGNVLLGGAVFRLYRLNELGVWQRYGDADYTTLTDGSFGVEDLPEGSYFFQEIIPPAGYFRQEARVPFTIDAGHGVEHPVVLRVPNQLIEVPVAVRKVDAGSGQGLPGARFLLFETTNEQIEIAGELVSGADGQLLIPPLAYGSYRLVEIAPPDGYESRFSEYLDVSVEGDAQGNAHITYRTQSGTVYFDPEEEILLPNSPASSTGKRLVVNKLDLDDPDTPLDDSVFSLELRESGGGWTMLYPELHTDRYGLLEVEGLADGEYRLTETAPSVGYRAVEDSQVFHLNRSDTTVIEVYNQAAGRITVEKADSNQPDKKLAGAEFVLYYDTGGEGRSMVGRLEEVGAGETGEDGLLHFEHLKPGRYYVVQTRAPEGYRPIEAPELAGSTIVSYILDDQGNKVLYPEEVEIEVLAQPDMATATIHKVDAAVYRSAAYTPDHGLAGARIDLHRYDEEAHAWTAFRKNLVTSTDGRVVAAELPVGVYKLVERSAPAGYTPVSGGALDEVIFSVLPGDGVLDEEIVVENSKAPSGSSRITGERLPIDLPLEPENPHTGAEKPGRILLAIALLVSARLLWPKTRQK